MYGANQTFNCGSYRIYVNFYIYFILYIHMYIVKKTEKVSSQLLPIHKWFHGNSCT